MEGARLPRGRSLLQTLPHFCTCAACCHFGCDDARVRAITRDKSECPARIEGRRFARRPRARLRTFTPHTRHTPRPDSRACADWEPARASQRAAHRSVVACVCQPARSQPSSLMLSHSYSQSVCNQSRCTQPALSQHIGSWTACGQHSASVPPALCVQQSASARAPPEPMSASDRVPPESKSASDSVPPVPLRAFNRT